MTLSRYVIAAVSFLFLAAGPGIGQDKSSYDLPDPASDRPGGISRTQDLGIQGKIIIRSLAAFSVMPGGFYTFGTTKGLSPTGLDSACSITFGHPFAKTSYPLLSIDGTWGKPAAFFDIAAGTFEPVGDSITLTYARSGLASYTVRFRIDLDGRLLHVNARIQNLDTAAHVMGLGFVADPALGPWGDGALWSGTEWVLRDTLFPATLPAVQIHERRAGYPGMRLSLDFPTGAPSTIIAANWADLAERDQPDFVPSALRRLYDLVLRLGWDPAALPPGGSMEKGFDFQLLTPDFGTKVFLRWKYPDHFTLDDGVLFPAAFTSTAMLSNLTAQPRPAGTVELVGDGQFISGGAPQNVALGASARSYTSIPSIALDSYQPVIADLALVYREQGVVIDSVTRPVYLPAVPVSDTGLVVTIDTLYLARPPSAGVVFEVQRKSTGARILNLAQQNVALYDNGNQVRTFTLGRDTVAQKMTDIVFVLDVTGSMSEEIAGVKNNIIEFADSLAKRVGSFRLGMITFGDLIESSVPFTTDVAAFKQSVAAQYAHGGGDLPENSLDALWLASEMPFDPQAQRLALWITDASYHERGDGTSFSTRVRQEVINRLLETDLVVYAIGDPAYQTDWYNPVINATGGLFYDIRGNFRDILLDVSRRLAISRYLASYQLEAAPSHALTLWVHYGGLGGSTSASFPGGTGSTAGTDPIQCYPNPFNPETLFRLEVPGQARASITIYNLLGQEMRRFTDIAGPGRAEVRWNATDAQGMRVAGGVYFVRCDVRAPSGEMISQDHLKIIYLK